MKSINISLPESMQAYIQEQVASGAYGTASEYFWELVRQDQKRKEEARLETLLLEGLDSGEVTPMTAENWSDIRQAVRERVAKNNDAGQGE
ncbi:conserved hypothetical protein [Planktothrix agardhii]|uniref:type II toxin-antitoxin system ParD family antitoxin n=1 Tax=Planktothrix agardhii TaxID=1160 RepID=UPI001B9A8161|nr:type II toxin-antitoxin system ParD family antitoxin [Planktothrix agardhii]CAD0229261.1 conserved hypothetical protein [Planktothrix agardhii]